MSVSVSVHVRCRADVAALPRSASDFEATLPPPQQSDDQAAVLARRKQYVEQGYLHLPKFFSATEVDEMRGELYELMTNRDNRPSKMRYSVMDPMRASERPPPDERNPDSVVGVLDQPLASSFWLDQISHPRLMALLVSPFRKLLLEYPHCKTIHWVTTVCRVSC